MISSPLPFVVEWQHALLANEGQHITRLAVPWTMSRGPGQYTALVLIASPSEFRENLQGCHVRNQRMSQCQDTKAHINVLQASDTPLRGFPTPTLNPFSFSDLPAPSEQHPNPASIFECREPSHHASFRPDILLEPC